MTRTDKIIWVVVVLAFIIIVSVLYLFVLVPVN